MNTFPSKSFIAETNFNPLSPNSKTITTTVDQPLTLGGLIPRHTRRSQGQQTRERNQTGQEMGIGHLRLILSNPAKQIVMHPP